MDASGKTKVVVEAAGLLSENGENAEYDRAIVELTCRSLDLATDEARDMITHVLRIIQDTEPEVAWDAAAHFVWSLDNA